MISRFILNSRRKLNLYIKILPNIRYCSCAFASHFRANPYQKVIQILGRTLEPLTESGRVYAYGFGDSVSQDVSVFNLNDPDEDDDDEDKPCHDFRQGTLRKLRCITNI